MVKGPSQKARTLQSRILSGSLVLLLGSGLTTAINLAYNLSVARFLGPAGYGHATVIYTLLTLISGLTLSFQIVAAKVVAQQVSDEGKSAVYKSLHRAGWICGIAVALLLLVFAGSVATYLHLPGPELVAVLAVGAAFYVPLGSRRGYIQGAYGFRLLATNLVIEGAVRLGGSLLLMLWGLGVHGVIAANSAAVAVAYLLAASKPAPAVGTPIRFSRALQEVFQGVVFFSGQVLINNCDIILVKHFFASRSAGLYAAVAMVGRVIFAFSYAVVNTMYPIVAGTSDEERKNFRVIATSLALVLSIGSVSAVALRIAPARLWTKFFGAGFELGGNHGFSYLMALYAVTTVIYSLSVVIITYEMSYKIANTSWVQLAFSGFVIAAICLFHSSLQQVILVQLVMMSVLFIVVAIPFLINLFAGSRTIQPAEASQCIRLIRRLSEDEVIAEFLKTDFHNSVFEDFRQTLQGIVMTPNLEDANENTKRRALFFLRHRSLWTEIPVGTEWYEVEVGKTSLHQVRAFPRAQWRKIARGDYSITEIARRMRTLHKEIQGPFLAKIAAIRESLVREDADLGAVILIGLNECEPLTVLDGNHRLVSAILDSPDSMDKLRFLCGLSPNMMECCWYNTNMATLFRYGKNLLRQVVRNPNKELVRLLQSFG